MRRIIVVVLATILALSLLAPVAIGKANQGKAHHRHHHHNHHKGHRKPPANPNPEVVPPFQQVYGPLSAAWWQWAYSIPAPENPLVVQNETNGAKCAAGQSGNVWFLGGLFAFPGQPFPSGPVERTCNVPAGKELFFPIFNVECSTVESNPPPVDANGNPIPSDPSSVNTLEKCAKYVTDWGLGLLPDNEPPGSGNHKLASLNASIDGVAIQDLDAKNTPYRVASGRFTFNLPKDNINTFCLNTPPDGTLIQCPAGPSEAAADGVYLLLVPLPAGPHTIHFGGTFFDGGATLDVTYHINQG